MVHGPLRLTAAARGVLRAAGISLLFLPILLAPSVHPPMLFFIVFYGLDWVATVPPTLALCREHYGDDSPIVFGWVLASHQVGAAVVAFAGVWHGTRSARTTWSGTRRERCARRRR
ncbi:hypothetical protein SHKM778_88210 [Streptomyces sp. KM77-8]|uniref:MFS transporter n=1 Tax=Streptomyces haneummycinicus TaxID=3074435 RepID=A0AAT9HYG5_9ACTN